MVAPAKLFGAGWMSVMTKFSGSVAGPSHPVQMVINRSGFVRCEHRRDDGALVRRRNVRVGQLLHDADDFIDSWHRTGAGFLFGVPAIRVSRCGLEISAAATTAAAVESLVQFMRGLLT